MPAATKPSPIRAGIYCRISDDQEGLALGVQRQEEDCRRLADQRGWEAAAVYTDNSVSAFKRNKKRPEFERMLADLESGAIEALVVYDMDRYSRQPRDLERLIDLFESKKTLHFAAVTGGDTIDLNTSNGRLFARQLAAWANKSSEDTGRRVARKHLELAQRGVPVSGIRPFGYLDDLVSPHPQEAPLVRKAVADLLDGKTDLTKITREWNELGFTSTRGLKFQRQTVKQLLRNPRIAGWRTHNRKVVRDVAGEPVRGLWEPLVDPETFARLEAFLADARGVTGARPGKRRYLLASIVRCGVCSTPLTGNAYGPKPDDEKQERPFYYRCAPATHGGCGKVSISGAKTDDLISKLVRAKLADVKATKSVGWPDADQLVGKQERVSELMAAYTSGTLSGSVVFPAVEDLERDIADLRASEQAWTRDHRQEAPVRVDQWDDLNNDVRRALVSSIIQSVVVKKSEGGPGGAFQAERVSVVWRE